MVKLSKFHDPARGQMQVVGLMSGSGTNLVEIIEYERLLERKRGESPYHVAVIFSDKAKSNASTIGAKYDRPVVIRDKWGYYAQRGKPLNDLEVRKQFDCENIEALEPFKAEVAAYAGYMSIATNFLLNAYLGINVHPADLSIVDEKGKRKYRGANAVRDAILAGEKQLRSTTHIVESEVDGGRILMISRPVEVVKHKYNVDLLTDDSFIKEDVDKMQNMLKEKGDWIIFPKTLELIADGKFEQDDVGNIFFNGEHTPYGIKMV